MAEKIEEIEIGPLSYYIKKEGRDYTIWLNGCRIGRPRPDKPAGEIWEWNSLRAALNLVSDKAWRIGMTATVKPELLTDAALAEIATRFQSSTEGTWTPYYRVSPRGAHKQWHIGNEAGLCQITIGGKEKDYVFMAAAHQDIPALLGHVEALQAENQRLQSEANDVRAAAEAYQQRINAAIITLRGNKE
jgi:hypothetical protein